jgi:hypothetical protein
MTLGQISTKSITMFRLELGQWTYPKFFHSQVLCLAILSARVGMSVSCFQEKEKRGEMVTKNDNIK